MAKAFLRILTVYVAEREIKRDRDREGVCEVPHKTL